MENCFSVAIAKGSSDNDFNSEVLFMFLNECGSDSLLTSKIALGSHISYFCFH